MKTPGYMRRIPPDASLSSAMAWDRDRIPGLDRERRALRFKGRYGNGHESLEHLQNIWSISSRPCGVWRFILKNRKRPRVPVCSLMPVSVACGPSQRSATVPSSSEQETNWTGSTRIHRPDFPTRQRPWACHRGSTAGPSRSFLRQDSIERAFLPLTGSRRTSGQERGHNWWTS